ncbi:hypothetical protein HPB52_000152 [Rhipicephalus sanguineus]|uniref:Uncharacterized protein n=1 Tax=Rhipicephalus sanguineus TaxID=34632 RepID=A0A9D4PE74_RHISA|nr:hypothetical protein HPB52_000152 [Rhipicephalus sanguineus]
MVRDGEWDEKTKCVDAGDADYDDYVNDAAGVEETPVEEASDNRAEKSETSQISEKMYAERFNSGKYKDEEADRNYVKAGHVLEIEKAIRDVAFKDTDTHVILLEKHFTEIASCGKSSSFPGIFAVVAG